MGGLSRRLLLLLLELCKPLKGCLHRLTHLWIFLLKLGLQYFEIRLNCIKLSLHHFLYGGDTQ